MDSRDLNDDRFCVVCSLLQRVNELSKILNRVNVMVRGRGDGITAFRYHPCPGYIADDLGAGKVSSDTGLCTLSHLDLKGCTCLEIVGVNAETSRCHLYDGVCTVLVKVLVQAAFTGVVEDTELL